VADLLSLIEEILRQERELFGEMLLTDPPLSRKEVPMARPTSKVDEEPTLFGGSPPAQSPVSREPWASAGTLESMEQQVNTCLKCSLGHTRTKFVFGVGNPHATLMLIGEAPGADEDAQGEPFVGRAGQLLNKILEAIHFRREDVYICNILKCRPPGNRKPLPEEAETCLPYLRKQIELVRPKLILCLGLTAAENLLGTRESLTQLRGRVLSYEGTPLMVTYHPAALLRNPNWKRPTWEDVQAARRYHDELVAQQGA
jgi:uracil-DNA glycosylase